MTSPWTATEDQKRAAASLDKALKTFNDLVDSFRAGGLQIDLTLNRCSGIRGDFQELAAKISVPLNF